MRLRGALAAPPLSPPSAGGVARLPAASGLTAVAASAATAAAVGVAAAAGEPPPAGEAPAGLASGVGPPAAVGGTGEGEGDALLSGAAGCLSASGLGGSFTHSSRTCLGHRA